MDYIWVGLISAIVVVSLVTGIGLYFVLSKPSDNKNINQH